MIHYYYHIVVCVFYFLFGLIFRVQNVSLFFTKGLLFSLFNQFVYLHFLHISKLCVCFQF